MASFIATYELQASILDANETFIKAALKLGWSSWLLATDNSRNHLPKMTLIGNFTDLQMAVQSFKSIRIHSEATFSTPMFVKNWIVAQYLVSQFCSEESIPAF